jgi:hypothetical protein
MADIEGGCLCGRVRYSVDAEPTFVAVCHCKDCQKFSGSAFATVIGVPTMALRLTGTMRSFTKPGDSGKAIHRYFCPECGSGITDEADAMPDVTMIGAGTLDDPNWVKPTAQIYCDSAQSWVQLGDELKPFAKTPK